MPRSVYDVDFYALISNGHILGQDCDSSFSLEVVGIQYQLSQILGLTHQVGLIDHPVNHGGLPVVYVGY